MKVSQPSNFDDATPFQRVSDHPPAPFRLTDLEREVVALARNDNLASLAEGGPLSKGARLIVGYSPPAKLANPKLEALRRFAVLVRCVPAEIDADEVDQMLSAGFSDMQIAEVTSMLKQVRPPGCRSYQGVLLAAPAIAIVGGIFIWLSHLLGDPLISTVLLATILLPIIAAFGSNKSH
jgi:hypothetical protein